MADLIIYDSGRAQSKSTALTAMVALPGAEVKDFYDLALSAIDTYVGTLDAAKYDKIAVCVDNIRVEDTAGVTGDISQEYFIDLEAKIKAAPVATGTAAAVANSTITLAVGSSEVDDYYAGMTIYITSGGTGPLQARNILSYVGSTRVATIDYAWGTNPTANTYVISQDLIEFGRTVDSIKPPRRAWEVLVGLAYEVPTVITMLGGSLTTYKYAKNDLTSTGAATGTLTDHGEFTANAYDKATNQPPYFIAVKSSDTLRSAGQVKEITSNTANVIILTDFWDVTPDATSTIYQIGREKYMLWDEFLPLAIETEMNFSGDVWPSAAAKNFKYYVDQYDGVANGRSKIHEDMTAIEALVDIGRIVFKAKAEAVVT